ncbi:hypothetical protein D3C72_1991070 [compost metagenome]
MGEPWAVGDAACEFLCLGKHRRTLVQRIVEAPGMSLRCGHHPTGEEQLCGATLADDAGKNAAGAHVRSRQPDAGKKERGLRFRRRQAEIGGHRQDGAGAGTDAVDG